MNIIMKHSNLKDRTKIFALRVIKMVEALPKSSTARVVGNQLLRCGTSVASNYRSSCRAKSRADFISKMSIVEEEADECMFWMEIIMESGLLDEELVKSLYNEANELVSIVVSSKKTSRNNK